MPEKQGEGWQPRGSFTFLNSSYRMFFLSVCWLRQKWWDIEQTTVLKRGREKGTTVPGYNPANFDRIPTVAWYPMVLKLTLTCCGAHHDINCIASVFALNHRWLLIRPQVKAKWKCVGFLEDLLTSVSGVLLCATPLPSLLLGNREPNLLTWLACRPVQSHNYARGMHIIQWLLFFILLLFFLSIVFFFLLSHK